MAQIVYEALQFCKIVPNRIESDIRELERAIDLYSNLQEKLDRMSSIKSGTENDGQSLDNLSLSGVVHIGGALMSEEDKFAQSLHNSNNPYHSYM